MSFKNNNKKTNKQANKKNPSNNNQLAKAREAAAIAVCALGWRERGAIDTGAGAGDWNRPPYVSVWVFFFFFDIFMIKFKAVQSLRSSFRHASSESFENGTQVWILKIPHIFPHPSHIAFPFTEETQSPERIQCLVGNPREAEEKPASEGQALSLDSDTRQLNSPIALLLRPSQHSVSARCGSQAASVGPLKMERVRTCEGLKAKSIKQNTQPTVTILLISAFIAPSLL